MVSSMMALTMSPSFFFNALTAADRVQDACSNKGGGGAPPEYIESQKRIEGCENNERQGSLGPQWCPDDHTMPHNTHTTHLRRQI